MDMARQTRSPLTLIGIHKITLDGQAISYVVKRSPRARYARLEVSNGTGLTVVIPKSYELAQVPKFIKEKRRWILDKLAKFGKTRLPSAQKELKSGDVVPYLGQNVEVVTQIDHRKTDSVYLDGNRLMVSLGSKGSRLSSLLECWYRQKAEELFRDKVGRLCSMLGVNHSRLSIRGAKTRWGSCSHKGNLNFNWKLMMVPESVIDYVIIHELAHLKEMNHSRKFWNLVAEQCPQWRKHRKWLKDHEAELATKLLNQK